MKFETERGHVLSIPDLGMEMLGDAKEQWPIATIKNGYNTGA